MNTNLLAISNIFAGISGIGSDPAKPAAIRKSKQFFPPILENTSFTNALGTITVDNTLIKVNEQLKNETPKEFSHTFQKGMTTNVPQKKAENSGKATKQNLTQIPAEQPNVVQLWLAEHFLNVGHGKEGVAQKVEPKAGYELAQLLVNSREQKSPYGAGKATRPQTTKPDQIIDHKQTCPEATSPKTSEQPLITETTTNKGENANRIKMPDTTPLPTKGLDNEKSGEGFTLQPLIRAHHRMTTADGKPEDVPVSNIFASRQKPALAGEGLTPKALVDASGEITTVIQKPAVAGKPVVPNSQKVYEHNSKLLMVRNKPDGLDRSFSNNSANLGFEQIFSGNNAAAYVEEQTSAFSADITTDNMPTQISPGGVAVSITEQILESIQSSSIQQAGIQKITIRLNPPELGKVIIKFEEQENQIIGLLEVDKTHTRYEVEQALPQIIQNLSDSGIHIKRLEVMLTDQNEQPSYGEESLRDGLFQQHHNLPEWDNPNQPGTIGANEPSIFENNSNYQDGLGPQMQISAYSINILI